MKRPKKHQAIPTDVLDQAIKGAPRGAFRYSSLEFAEEQLPPAMTDLVFKVAANCFAASDFLSLGLSRGLVNIGEDVPSRGIRVSYHWGRVMPSQSAFGNSNWHRDGKGHAAERHTLLVWPVAVDSDAFPEHWSATTMFRYPICRPRPISAGVPVTYPGSIEHKMVEVPVEHDRLVIRVSSTWMRVRNHWTAWEE